MALDDFKRAIQGGDFFKPADHMSALAIVVEVEDFNPAADNPFKDKKGEDPTRPIIVATFSIFNDQGQLKNGDPLIIESGVIGGYKGLTRDLGENVGKTLALTLGKRPTKAGNPVTVWEPVTDEKVRAAVNAYLKKRDAETSKAPF